MRPCLPRSAASQTRVPDGAPGHVVADEARRHEILTETSGVVTLITAGVCLGLLGSFGFTGVTGTLVFGVSTADAATFASMAALLAVISVLAFVIPIRAATRLDAVAAIRHE